MTSSRKDIFLTKLLTSLRVALACVISLALVAYTPVMAVDNSDRIPDDATLDFFDANGIYYYNPKGTNYNCDNRTNGNNITYLGDSITKNDITTFQQSLPQAEFYAYWGKTFGKSSDSPTNPEPENANPSGFSIAKYLAQENKLRNIIVVELGTNGGVSEAVAQAFVDEFGTGRQIYFVNIYYKNTDMASIVTSTNNAYDEVAQNQGVNVIDWNSLASQHTDWFTDQLNPAEGGMHNYVHPTTEGAKALADLINKSVGGSQSVTGVSNGNYTNYAGKKVLTDDQISLLETKLIGLYQQAIQETGAASHGVTWQLLAAIHYKESTFAWEYNPPDYGVGAPGQGVWGLLYHAGEFPNNAYIGESGFLEQTKLMIQEALIDDKLKRYDISTDDGIKELFLSYNGYGEPYYAEKAEKLGYPGKIYEGSPYVMNYYDAARDPDKLTSSDIWAGYFCRDGHYCPGEFSQQMGAFVVYSALGGATSVCADGGVISSGGLTAEQTRALILDYIYLSHNDIHVKYNAYASNCDYGARANCVTFSQYFANRFIKGVSGNLTQTTGNGKFVVSTLTQQTIKNFPPGGTFTNIDATGNAIFTYSDEPSVFAIFSTGTNPDPKVGWGHTGAIVGLDTGAGVGYLAQQGCGCNSAFELLDQQLVKSLDTLQNGGYRYAVPRQDAIDFDEIQRAVNNGMQYIDEVPSLQRTAECKS